MATRGEWLLYWAAQPVGRTVSQAWKGGNDLDGLEGHGGNAMRQKQVVFSRGFIELARHRAL